MLSVALNYLVNPLLLFSSCTWAFRWWRRTRPGGPRSELGESLLRAPETIGLLVVPLGLFLFCLFALGTGVACLGLELPMPKAVTVGFHVMGRNAA